MSIFGDMFDDDADLSKQNAGSRSSGTLAHGRLPPDFKIPPPRRLHTGLCGIYNQGATCYLNSLLQTLNMTPEFRESLFHLGEEELGKLEDRDKPGAKVRVIPLHLQKLFARMLLSNQQGTSTTELTDSFGWTSNEELQQHDVQELNRILFSAIEDSLVGTVGQNLIHSLYHGTIVNQIICSNCRRVSEREEDFLDLCLAVAGHDTLEQALDGSYCSMELMEGRNQYRCDTCNRLVNAEKGARLRHLPSILTISLLRFSFDFEKMERYKETSKFAFPTSLDMSRYCENNAGIDDAEYELFSVVIHRGSTHGGHYHAYIRDVDGLGKWTHPDEEEIQMTPDPTTGTVDLIEFDSPLQLLQALVTQHGDSGVGIDKLCADLVKQTGVSWNKRFKRHHGPITKFLKKHDDIFELDPGTNTVTLWAKPTSGGGGDPASPSPATRPATSPVVSPGVHSEKKPPAPGHCWFDFDDSRVRPITEKQLEKQFSGKESAYMLFYRKVSMRRPEHAAGDPVYGIPEKLISEVLAENDQLEKERLEYEKLINTIDLEVHFGTSYDYQLGALKPVAGNTASLQISIDRRRSVRDLLEMVTEVGGVLVPADHNVIHHAKELPAGLHLYECLTDDLDQTVMQTPLAEKSKVFIWDGAQVCDKTFAMGASLEPVLLTITYGNPSCIHHGFPKTLLVRELRELISNSSSIPKSHLQLSRVISKGSNSTLQLLPLAEDADQTLADLHVVDGDHFIAENASLTGSALAESTIAQRSLLLSLMIENRCNKDTKDWPVLVTEINKTNTVRQLKEKILSQIGNPEVEDGGRLRIDDDNLGLGPPVCEQQTVEEAGLRQGMHVVFEPGVAPEATDITLRISFPIIQNDSQSKSWGDLELIVSQNTTVEELLKMVTSRTGLSDDKWHLRRTNWCGEATEVLDNQEATLKSCHVGNGDHLLVEEGRLPPHGFITLKFVLLGSPRMPPAGETKENILDWLSGTMKGLMSGLNNASEEHKTPDPPVNLGELLVSKEDTLEELKHNVINLPLLTNLPIPTPSHLRLRLMEQDVPSTVLRGDTTTLQRLKLTSASQIGVQILTEEERLNQNQMLLDICLRHTESRTYQAPIELVWNFSKGGATPAGLRHAVSELLHVPCEQLVMAKHLRTKYEWLIIKGGQAKKKGQGKVNLRHSPYHLREGDVIGVKVLSQGNNTSGQDDFTTVEDDRGRQRLKEEAELCRKRREENRQKNSILGLGDHSNIASKRREVGIKIHVADFR